MKTSELDYALPDDLIAQYPAPRRDESRLMIVDRARKAIHTDVFRNIGAYLCAGDTLVLNETRVLRARLRGRKSTGGAVEVFLLRPAPDGAWEALVRPSAKVKPGTAVQLGGGLEATVHEALPGGGRRVTFNRADVTDLLDQVGEIPLPPYIRRPRAEALDQDRYQTIYARHPGAVAAPTAGLHYTEAVFEALERAGVRRVSLTLHVGYGSFRPIRTERVEDHTLEAEAFDLPEDTAAQLDRTRAEGRRVVAVGTTTIRVLESRFREGRYRPGQGISDHYIYPPYTFRAVDVLQTNFHLPRSSLLALVCAFAGTELILDAYRRAVHERFRFYSYGDAMLIL